MGYFAIQNDADGNIKFDGAGGAVRVYANEYSFLVVAGQSNCRGNGDYTQSPTGTGKEVHTNGTIENSIVDPVGQNDSPFQIATTGSIWPALANKYYALTGKKLVVLALGVGGSAQHARADIGPGYWIGGASNIYNLAKAEIDAAITAIAAIDYDFWGIIWFQGETDAIAIHNAVESKSQYQSDLSTMIGYFASDYPGILFGIIQIASVTGYTSECAEIQDAQNNVANLRSDAFLAYDNDYSMVGWDSYTQSMYNAMAAIIGVNMVNNG